MGNGVRNVGSNHGVLCAVGLERMLLSQILLHGPNNGIAMGLEHFLQRLQLLPARFVSQSIHHSVQNMAL